MQEGYDEQGPAKDSSQALVLTGGNISRWVTRLNLLGNVPGVEDALSN